MGEVGGIQSTAETVVGEVLPRDGEAEHVEVVRVDEPVHLRRAVVDHAGAVRWRDVVERGGDAAQIAFALEVTVFL